LPSAVCVVWGSAISRGVLQFEQYACIGNWPCLPSLQVDGQPMYRGRVLQSAGSGESSCIRTSVYHRIERLFHLGGRLRGRPAPTPTRPWHRVHQNTESRRW
jgi:hypothetical protein